VPLGKSHERHPNVDETSSIDPVTLLAERYGDPECVGQPLIVRLHGPGEMLPGAFDVVQVSDGTGEKEMAVRMIRQFREERPQGQCSLGCTALRSVMRKEPLGSRQAPLGRPGRHGLFETRDDGVVEIPVGTDTFRARGVAKDRDVG
jgi:hypothetical protein